VGGENVVTQAAQRFDHGLREVLVGVETRQDSGVLVLSDLPFDLVVVRTHKKASPSSRTTACRTWAFSAGVISERSFSTCSTAT